jgi:two-component system chemotaxis response regulator CheB
MTEYVLNKPTSMSCPECGGTLAKIETSPIPKYACHIGHVLTGEAVLDAQADRIEDSLTSALATLNERRELCRQMIDEKISDRARLQRLFSEATHSAERIKELLNEQGSGPASM